MGISSPGIGSGLDINSIVNQLAAAESQPIVKLQSAAKSIQTQISAYGKVQGMVSALRDAAGALAQGTLWKQTAAVSSNSSAVTVASTGSAVPGPYKIEVSQLARAHMLSSTPMTAGLTTVGTGRMTIQVGQWDTTGNPPGFVPKSGSQTISLDFTDGSTTLEQVRDRINAAGGDVTAAIVNDANGVRLTLTSNATGVASKVQVTTEALNGTPLSTAMAGLNFSNETGSGGMTQVQPAANAKLTVNGLPVESASNQLDGVVEGLSMTLNSETTTPVTVNVTSDKDAQRTAMKAFADAYNALTTYLAQQTKYDDATKTAAPLQADSAAVGLRNQIRGLLNQVNAASPVFGTLSSVGFDVQKDGTISLNAKKLDAALAKPDELAKLFASPDKGVAGEVGIALRLRNFADRISGFDGSLTNRSDALRAQLDRNQKQQDTLQARVDRLREGWLKQYQGLDAKVAQLNGLSTYVTQQMALLAKG